MALDSAYATVAQYRAALTAVDTGADVNLERNLKSISRYLDWKLGFQQSGFNKDAATSVRLYDGTDTPELYVAPIASKTGLVVTVDDDEDGGFDHDTALSSDAFELRPLNADKGPVARPWCWIHLPTRGDRRYWPRESLIQVEAKHGWPQIPDGIVDATITLTAMFRVESTFSTMQIQQIDDSVQASPQARAIVKGLSQQYRAASPLVVMA